MAARFLPLRPDDPTEISEYKLRARLGSGGMGDVYLSFTRGGIPVAIKVVKRQFADDAEFRRRFRREIAAARQVHGRFTAPVLDADPEAEIPWLAVAYIAGPSVQTAVGENGPFPPFSVFRLLAGAAEGIVAVHAAGLIHRDLKPANVLLADDGPRVIDFGIAHAANSSTLTGTGMSIGTPAFMAPEQVRGNKVTAATDIFALGHLAVFAASGHTAFGEGNTDAMFYSLLHEPPDLDGCPDAVREIASSCLAKDPADRPGLIDIMGFARHAIDGDTMRLASESWLPQPVAATLPDYDTKAIPPVSLHEAETRVSAPAQPAAPTVQPNGPAAVPAPRRGLLRPAVTIPAAILIAAAVVIGFLLGNSGKAPGANPAANVSRTAPPATPTPAATSRTSPANTPRPPSPSTSGQGSPAASNYVLDYASRPFTLPAGGCGNPYPSGVDFTGAQPYVSTNDDQTEFMTVWIDCNNTPPSIAFSDPNDQGYQVQEGYAVSGTPDAAGCYSDVTEYHPISGEVNYDELRTGEQLCLVETDSQTSSEVVVLLTLESIDDSGSYDTSWDATVWSGAAVHS